MKRRMLLGLDPDGSLFVRLSFDAERPVAKVLTRENVEVGINQSALPVYVRIAGIDTRNGPFGEISAALQHSPHGGAVSIPAEHKKLLLDYCVKKAGELTVAYIQKNLSSVGEATEIELCSA